MLSPVYRLAISNKTGSYSYLQTCIKQAGMCYNLLRFLPEYHGGKHYGVTAHIQQGSPSKLLLVGPIRCSKLFSTVPKGSGNRLDVPESVVFYCIIEFCIEREAARPEALKCSWLQQLYQFTNGEKVCFVNACNRIIIIINNCYFNNII